MPRLVLSFLLLVLGAVGAQAGERLVLQAADHVKVFGDLEASHGGNAPLVLLFHMAGSNRGEYIPIAARLNKAGYDTLAIDQRSGGSLWGRDNETVRTLGRDGGYAGALADLEAALAWAKQNRQGPVIAVGSSYSASLVFALAARHPGDLAGILSFSPGEYFSDPAFVRKAAAKVTVPVFATTASSSGEIEEARAILAVVPGTAKTQFEPHEGRHGASTLREDSNPRGAAENWKAVNGFLQRVAAPHG